jgi:diguanylate cyclase (GGDEF)-like protein
VLKDVAGSVREEIRESAIFARFGGEEFVIVFTDIESTKGKLFVERIRQRISLLEWRAREQEVKITTSIGVYCLAGEALEQSSFNIDTLLHYADQALYAAKAAGRNRVVFSQLKRPNNRMFLRLFRLKP